MENKRITELKKRIEEYVSAGGNIYAPKRQLPYYDYLSDTVKALRKTTGKEVTHEDVYQMCGIEFDREFHHFKNFLKQLKPFVRNGYADAIRTKEAREANNVYEMLKNYADKYNTTPFDFLVLMTGFKFENCYVRTNYIENLKAEILAVYPNGDVGGIRWEHPALYEKLRILQKYLPGVSSNREAVEYLGFTNHNMAEEQTRLTNKTAVLEELKTLFPKKKITNLRTVSSSLYYKVIACCREENKSTVDWMKENGFTYENGQVQPRLSQTKVDGNKRAKMLMDLKNKALANYDFSNASEISLFRASLSATKEVIEELAKQNIQSEVQENATIE